MKQLSHLKFAVAFLTLLVASCTRSHGVVVGSKNFTEQIVLGEIAAQQIERTLHVSVARRLDLGGTLLAHLSLVKGEIDLSRVHGNRAYLGIEVAAGVRS